MIDIEKIQKLNSEIDIFRDAYKECVLYGSSPDYCVTMENMLKFLIENPHLHDIAMSIEYTNN